MYHSIIFEPVDYDDSHKEDRKNTWDDWFIAPTKRPSFNMPEFQTQYVEVPGMSGQLDMSTVLTGYPLYKNREGSWDFVVDNDHREWYDTYNRIAAYLHGQQLVAILEDDPMYFYQGRFTLGDWNSEQHRSEISINYNVDPYKYMIWTTTDNRWLWDPFNFRTGVLVHSQYADILVNNSDSMEYRTYSADFVGEKPSVPTFKVTSTDGITVEFTNPELGIDKYTTTFTTGDFMDANIIFSARRPSNTITVGLQGKGTVSIDFRIGRL